MDSQRANAVFAAALSFSVALFFLALAVVTAIQGRRGPSMVAIALYQALAIAGSVCARTAADVRG